MKSVCGERGASAVLYFSMYFLIVCGVPIENHFGNNRFKIVNIFQMQVALERFNLYNKSPLYLFFVCKTK